MRPASSVDDITDVLITDIWSSLHVVITDMVITEVVITDVAGVVITDIWSSRIYGHHRHAVITGVVIADIWPSLIRPSLLRGQQAVCESVDFLLMEWHPAAAPAGTPAGFEAAAAWALETPPCRTRVWQDCTAE
jgi:hypothetical protein